MINSGDINFSFQIDNLTLNEIIYNNDLWKIFAFVSITNNSILRRREATAPLVSSLVDQLIENVEKWLDLVQPGYVSLSFESLLLLAIPTLLKSRSPFFFAFNLCIRVFHCFDVGMAGFNKSRMSNESNLRGTFIDGWICLKVLFLVENVVLTGLRVKRLVKLSILKSTDNSI